MAMLNFKYGLYENLPDVSNSTQGTVFVTSDEQAMYIDLPAENQSTKRIRIGDIVIFENARVAKPPFSEKAIYYFAEENALLRWKLNADRETGSWTQINSISDATASIAAVQEALDKEIDRATKAEEKALADAKAYTDKLGETVAAVSEVANRADSNASQALTDAANAQAAADAAAEAAAAAQSTANAAKTTAEAALPRAGGTMTGNIVLDNGSGKPEVRITGVIAPTSNDHVVNKKYVDDINGVLSQQIAGNTAALSAQAEVISGVSEKAQQAYDLAGQKTTLDYVKKFNYATKAEAQGYANAVRGTDNEAATAITVYGAHAAAAIAKAAADAAQEVADEALPKVGGVATNLTLSSNPTTDMQAATKSYVDSEIESKLQAADAMTFKGVINSADYTGKTFNKGDTYKVGTDFNAGTSENPIWYRRGDLLIHEGADEATTPTWAHVSSGYEDDFNQIIGLDSTNNTLFLTDGISSEENTTTGKIKFDTSGNLKVESSTGVNNTHTVAFSMVWGTF